MLSRELVKRALASHSWLGLAIGALMYVVCLTGTVAVFYGELERWEQPAVAESTSYDAAELEAAFNRFLADPARVTGHMYLHLPTDSYPRVRMANEQTRWLYDAGDRTLVEEHHPWTELLVRAHLYLTLPGSIGIMIVSGLGALLFGLIVSGFLAHPRILRDAFVLRWGRGDRLQNVDVHNRLSVWGAPFHVMIALTGAWFGLIVPLVDMGTAVTGEDRGAILSDIFGAEPPLQPAGPIPLAGALDSLRDIAPDARPMSVTVHEADQPERFFEINARHPGRLIWSENYRFDTAGNYLGAAGFRDGDAGKQVAYSLYLLHFGHFDGLRSKLLYLILGLALTVVAATGISIWLSKRTRQDSLTLAWPGLVWGFPLALAATAVLQVSLNLGGALMLWSITAAAVGGAVLLRDPRIVRRRLQQLLASVCLVLVAAHGVRHGTAAFSGAALGMNAGIFGVASCLLLLTMARGSPGQRGHGNVLTATSESAEETIRLP